MYSQRDPIGLAGGNPSLYGYVWDSTRQVDVFGLEPKVPSIGNNSNNFDFIEGGTRLDGIKYTDKQYKNLKNYLEDRGLKLEINDDFLNSKGANGALLLKSDALYMKYYTK